MYKETPARDLVHLLADVRRAIHYNPIIHARHKGQLFQIAPATEQEQEMYDLLSKALRGTYRQVADGTLGLERPEFARLLELNAELGGQGPVRGVCITYSARLPQARKSTQRVNTQIEVKA